MNEIWIYIGIGVINCAALGRVIWIQNRQTKTQSELIQNMEKYSSNLNQYTKIFEMETIEKYVAKREEIMKLDNELLRRKTIKDTSEKVAKEFSKRADDYIPRELAGVMNDLGYFAFWFFTNHMNKDGKMEEHVKEMFPDSHEMVLGYIRHHTELAEKRKKP